jgi:pyruvate/2-oxoglutarate dehydrogenase complex dihydrolipoamide dehydrogenase (E3) component
MKHAQYDMTIVGGGSGGLTAARIAASLGANVLLIDKERLGGDCLHYGCVPSKSLIHVARVVQQAKDAAKLGLLPANLDVDMAKVSEYVQGVISRVAEGEKVYIEGVTVQFGRVFFKSATELDLNGESISTCGCVSSGCCSTQCTCTVGEKEGGLSRSALVYLYRPRGGASRHDT